MPDLVTTNSASDVPGVLFNMAGDTSVTCSPHSGHLVFVRNLLPILGQLLFMLRDKLPRSFLINELMQR